MDLNDFLKTYFIEPVLSSQGYNVYNTVVYAILFLVGAYLADKLLKRFEIEPGEELYWALVPFVFLGGVIRALGQYTFVTGSGILPLSIWFFTPGIYLLISFFAILSLWITATVRREGYVGLMYVIGGIPVLLGLAYVLDKAARYDEFLLIIGASLIVGLLVFGALHSFGQALYSRANILIISGFILDSTTTTIATAYLGYAPEHVLTGVISSASPFLFLPFKLLLILAALYFIEKDSNERDKWLFKLALLILGLPHGIHDSLQILMGV